MHRLDNKGSAAIKQTNDGQAKEKRYLSSSDYRSQSMRAFAVYGFVRALSLAWVRACDQFHGSAAQVPCTRSFSITGAGGWTSCVPGA